MSNLPVTKNMSAIELALARNDISKLSSDERVSYLNALCSSVRLNPLTKPFAFLTLQGREVVYATKDCTEQLRKIHGVSTTIVSQGIVDGCYEVHVKARDITGRQDEDFASIPVGTLKAADLSNLKMKCVTKAKRRVTLSICGLGLLDESELDTIPTELKTVTSNPQIENPFQAEEKQTEIVEEDPGEYVVSGGKFKDKKLKDIDMFELDSYLQWVIKSGQEKQLSQKMQEFSFHAEKYLISRESPAGKKDGGLF